MGGVWALARAKRLRVLALGLFVLPLVACDPITHPDFVVREGPTSPVTFELLSGDGNFVVVRSTGPSATVPAAGRWRIDRSDGSRTLLPSGDYATKISRDGSRVLVTTGATSVVWSSGTSLVPPAGTQFSPDLTFGVFVGGGVVKTWNTATQAIGAVETGFPRPAGTTGAVAKGVSNDGRTVQYTLNGAHPIERFVNLDTGRVLDRPNLTASTCCNPEDFYTNDLFVLAAEGSGFVHVHEEGRVIDFSYQIVDEAAAELVALPAGTTQGRYTYTGNTESISKAFISTDGKAAWLYQSQIVLGSGFPCEELPAPDYCVVASHVVAFRGPNLVHRFDSGPGEPGGIDISALGRFLLLDREIVPLFGLAPKGPVRIFDAYAKVEALDQSQTYLETVDSVKCRVYGFSGAPCTVPALSTGAQVSDDLSVVATTTNTGKGWYEYTAAPAPARLLVR